ncbi:MAG: DUF6460 domain-containing protein [Rhodospirillales bacterium]|jgi:hypothetical protein|nr:DUF6460 domain-containing protein [Rhodospirillales bacterium]
MVRSLLSTALKVAFACLVVGLVLSAFGIDPWQLYGRFGDLAGDAAAAVAGFIGWAWPYVVVGAVIVVPLWLAMFLLRGGWRR